MADCYNVEKIIDALNNKGYSNFINQKELSLIKGKLNKNSYKIYNFYEECNKVILYKKDIPNITLIRIDANSMLRHQDIMGCLYNLGIKDDTFGDVIKYQDKFYVFVLPEIKDYVLYNVNMIGNEKVKLEEDKIEISSNFKVLYDTLEVNTSSLRIDNVIASILNISRKEIIDKFNNKEIILNLGDDFKITRKLNEGDYFSVRKYGKYKFAGVIRTTKKGSLIVKILKYK